MMAKCKAHGRLSKKPCGNSPVTGRAVCRMHGGATPRGTASPHYKHGLYSRYAQTDLAAKIDEMRQEEERLRDICEVLSVQGALLGEALAQNELTAAVAITEAISRSIERYNKHNPPVLPQPLSGQAARDHAKTLLAQADELRRRLRGE